MAQYDVKLQIRRDTLANWQTNDPELLEGELAIAYLSDDEGVYTGLDSIKHGIGGVWSEAPSIPLYSSNEAIIDVINNFADSDSINFYFDVATQSYKWEVVTGGHTHSYNALTDVPTTITTNVSSTQQTLLANTANWSIPTSSGASYYIGATALSGNYQGQFYFDGLYFFFFIADNFPIRLGGNIHGNNIVTGTIAITAMDTTTQGKLNYANTEYLVFRCDPDIKTTSDPLLLKGLVYDVTEDRMAEDGSVPASGTFTYGYRLSTSANWTSNQSLAQLKTALTNASDANKLVWVRATNTTSSIATTAMISIKRYA